MFNIGQTTAVKGAFALAGYDGPLRTLPIDSEDERFFLLSRRELEHLRQVRILEQVISQVLGRKVAILDDEPFPQSVPFE